jgi:hypothetical protein
MGRGWGHSYFDRNRVFDDGQSIEQTNSFAIMALKATCCVNSNDASMKVTHCVMSSQGLRSHE